MRWRWLIVLAPVTVGVAISVWLNATDRAPLFFVTIDLGTVLIAMGTVLSLVIGGAMYNRTLTDQVRQETIAATDQDRRRFVRRLDHELKNPLTAILAGLASVLVLDEDLFL